MSYRNRWLVAVLSIACLHLFACSQQSEKPVKTEPAHVKPIAGSELSLVTLTEKAIQRIGVKTVEVRDAPRLDIRTASRGGDPEAPQSGSGTKRTVVPYAAVLYDVHGTTWVYTSPKPRTFVRHKIDVDNIEGDVAVLEDGPPHGTKVVTVGVALLFGTESGIGR